MGDIVGGVIGGIGSIFGADQASDAASDAARSQEAAAKYAADLQRDLYYQGRTDSTPYANLGAVSSPLLQYMATGIMPEMTPQELQLIAQYSQSQSPQISTMPVAQNALAQTGPPDQYFGQYNFKDFLSAPEADLDIMGRNLGILGRSKLQDYISQYGGQQQAGQGGAQPGQQFGQSQDIDQYALANALAKQKAINALGDGWSIQTSPAFQWQQDQTMRGLNRQAAAKGLAGSSAALNAQGNALNALAGSEYDRSYGRLLDLTNIGRGMQVTNASLGQNYAGNAGNALIGGAAAAAPFAAQAGNITGSMYANAGNALGYGLSNLFNRPSYSGAGVPGVSGGTYGGSSNFAFSL